MQYWQGRLRDAGFREELKRARQRTIRQPLPFILDNTENLLAILQELLGGQHALQDPNGPEPRGLQGESSSAWTRNIPQDISKFNYEDLNAEERAGKELGRGGFGVVLRGTLNGMPVAVKRLHLDRLTKQEKVEFTRELSILAVLGQHPNLVQLEGYCEGPPCIVMELVTRGSLSYLLHYSSDTKVEAVISDGRVKKRLLLGIVDGMMQLQKVRIVHSDLKPQNILVTDDWTAKITDFGLATLRGKALSSEASKLIQQEESSMNDVGGVGGTPAYMAPELLDSTKPPDYSADVYSFGVLLNEVVSEEEPYADQVGNFMGRGPFGVANYAKQGKRPTIQVPFRPLIDLIGRCWDADQKRRPKFKEVRTILADPEFLIPNSESFSTARVLLE